MTDKMDKVTNDFINKINKVYEQCVGYETFGDTIEFFDESGCILMSITENGPDKIQFMFADDLYDYTKMA